ncbi:hypothetical protein OB894_12895 [Bacillus subtilis]|uniref:Rap family tetratricopeptide repeat protein n=1 Tax=Bacillus subtilis TaxID=1423 RepID=UPI0027DFB4A1|nr:Rap family tetratricopeptide repeat protein [Bacillus subtilis]MDQ4712328.1 Rap family tetratricopeptide repeat protein [Bacillus subtilis]
MNLIPSANVGVKINEWYHHINKFDHENAEKLKSEITEMIDSMEEDQDLLIYYQLMLFRHYLMMSYLFPSDSTKKLEKWQYLKESEGKSQKITKLMEYYANFFEGMYHFSEGDYINGIQSYKKAEKRIYKVRDRIEKAEFYYKLAEVYYHMKQTHVSMFYVQKAYEIYSKENTYSIQKIHCLFVIAGNYVDLERSWRLKPLNFILRKSVWMILYSSFFKWLTLKNKFKGAISCMKFKLLCSLAIITGLLFVSGHELVQQQNNDFSVASRFST